MVFAFYVANSHGDGQKESEVRWFMVGGLFYTLPSIPGLTLLFVLILNSSHKILCDSSIMIEKASIYTMNALNNSSEL